MSARSLLLASLVVLSCRGGVSAPAGEDGSTNRRPNILWITREDNSPRLCCYGDEFATTPHLDGQYTIFGGLRAGGEVLDRIETGDRILDIRLLD